MGGAKNLRTLILGGTSFVGLSLAQEALSLGHDVTLFNRGTKPNVPGANLMIGDRLAPNGYAALSGLKFDIVLDTWSTDPIAVQTAVAALRGRIKQYTYISSISVYDMTTLASPPLTEESPVVDPSDPETNKYSSDKRGGELAALDSGVPTLLLRPGIILGPYENAGRLPWWLGRLRRGGRTLAPGPKDNGIQYIDARDLASFTISLAEKHVAGIYNIMSKPGHTTMEEFLGIANKAVGGKAELVWKDPETILAAGIKPWTDLPCWVPPGRDYEFMMGSSGKKARGVGLVSRPVRDTVVDTWEWLKKLDKMPPTKGKIGLDPEKEKAVLG